MKKIEINLYPYQVKSDKRIFNILRQFAPYIVLGCAVIIVINIILFIVIGFAHIPYGSLTKEWQELRPQAASIETLKRDVTDLKAKQGVYKELLTYKVEMSHLLADLFAALPKNIWLTEAHFKDDSFNLSGYAVYWKESPLTSIDKFIKNLKREEYYTVTLPHINLATTRKMDFHGKDVVKFEIQCSHSK